MTEGRVGDLHCHASLLWDQGKGAVIIFKVQWRSPIDRVILSDRAAGAVRSHEVVSGGSEVEVYTNKSAKPLEGYMTARASARK
jgi:hypothetical protein